MKKNIMMVRYTKRALLSLLAGMICWNLHAQLERENVQVIMDRFDLLVVKTGDMDGDGDEDVVATCNGWDGHIAVFENLDGQGHLSWPRLYGDSVWAGSRNFQGEFELVDMDQDGDLDVVDAYRARETVPYWANDGSGHLQPGSNESYEYGPVKPYERFKVGDVNADGWPDVVVGLDANVIWINLSAGSGQPFSPGLAYSDVVHHPSLVDMELADIDQDGDLDILMLENYHTSESTELTLHVLEWTGEAYSALYRSFLESEPDKHAWFDCDMSVVDVTGNGFPDAVYSHTGHGAYDRAYTAYLQLAPWGEAQIFWQSGETSGMIAHTMADADQDGDTDLIAYQQNLGYVWMERMPNGQLGFTNNLIDDTPTGVKLVSADLNGDGIADLLTYGDDNDLLSGSVPIFWRTGPLNSQASTASLNRTTSFLRDILPWDWDSDGQTDLMFCDDTGIAWLRNEGAGQNFETPVSLWDAPAGLGFFEFTAFDTDGLPDGIGTVSSGAVNWLPVIWNSSTGDTLSFPQFELRQGHHFDVADIDGDGDQDVALLTRESGVVVLWNEWSNGGSLSPQVVIPGQFGAAYVYSGILMDDLDQDEDADLVLRLNDGTFFALQQGASGQFSDLEEIGGMFGVDHLFAGDYNMDGRQDLRGRYVIQGIQGVLGMVSYDTVQQAFTPALERGYAGNTYIITEERLNTDSLPDYVTGEGFSFNVGATGFISTPFLPSPFDHYLPPALYQNACRADLNGDGTPELITGSQEIMAYQPNFSTQQLVQGQMVWDTALTCTFSTDWPGLPDGQLLLEGQDGPQQVLTPTATGYYAGYLPDDTTAYTLAPVLPNDYWQACPADTMLQGTGPHEVNFAVSPTVSCPLMELNMALSPVRQCFNSNIVLHYNNAGTISADSVVIQLFFDSRMTPVSASVPWSMQTDTSLTFELGTIEVEAEGEVVVQMEPNCEQLILGEVLCYQARISPDTLCAPGLTDWEGGNLRATYRCEQDSLKWKIENTGFGPVSIPVPYELNIVNDDIVLLQSGGLEVLPGESILLAAPADSTAYLLEAAQPEGHPSPEPIRLLAQGCLAPLDTGLVTAFPNDNGSVFEAEQCRPVIGAYDPNVKEAYPRGFGPDHLIPAEQELQYTIHFQNVGTDMARNVTIRDTLSPELDLSTFRAEGGSHEHQWHLLPDRILVVEYPEILLPDSTSNEPESHGFFAFSIQPLAGILPAALIENRAGIYFDFNPPVITNTVTHQIEKPVLASVVYASLCPGAVYLGQALYADTILEERFVAPLRDSVVWHHVDVLTLQDTTVVEVGLAEAGWWEGVLIQGDTAITEAYLSHAGCDSLVRYEISILTQLSETVESGGWSLAPNPARSFCTLSGPAVPAVVRILTAQGQCLQTLSVVRSDRERQLPLQGLPQGFYWVEVRHKEEVVRLPLVVLRE